MRGVIATSKAELQKLLRERISQSELSYRQLAALTRISKTRLREFEQDIAAISLETLMTLADYFELDYRIESPGLKSKKK